MVWGRKILSSATLIAASVVLVSAGCASRAVPPLLFQAQPARDSEDIYALDPKTGATRRLTQGRPEFANSFPAWSPALDQIAFVRQAQIDALFVLHVATGELRVVQTPELPVLGPPAWSPDGSEILIAAGEDSGGRRLYRVKAVGSGFSEIPFPPGMIDCGTYSPDASRIVASQNTTERSDVLLLDVAAGAIETLMTSDSARFHCRSGLHGAVAWLFRSTARTTAPRLWDSSM